MPAAERCVPVVSVWLRTAILMCDGTLSIEFKNGFCCNYPRSTRQHFLQLIAAPSPGHWLWRNLYRILPYRPIALPCPAAGCGVLTPCCSAGLPTTLHATVGLGGGTIALAYDGSIYWTGRAALSCPLGSDTLALRFRCAPGGTDCGGFGLDGSCNGGPWFPIQTGMSCSCSPLSVPFGPITLNQGNGCTACNLQQCGVTVTT